ncbi:hypothetical protein PLICRDRAFT_339020 [Plicaturopsis crispa FD-325 SS-3]|uniref:Uncharacterized protein n=1 Tax=Plicaturopsis crispa FD-325 SS-3 TaxID=944288 RepID=A0A0C9SS54_PLICR|nr:hypothetical protein PLICRDRAFT_339020 [Plicaturopsis crispa FD-325 SS-3]
MARSCGTISRFASTSEVRLFHIFFCSFMAAYTSPCDVDQLLNMSEIPRRRITTAQQTAYVWRWWYAVNYGMSWFRRCTVAQCMYPLCRSFPLLPIYFLVVLASFYSPSLLISSMMDGVSPLYILARPQRYVARRATVSHHCFLLHLVDPLPPASSISNALQKHCSNVNFRQVLCSVVFVTLELELATYGFVGSKALVFSLSHPCFIVARLEQHQHIAAVKACSLRIHSF